MIKYKVKVGDKVQVTSGANRGSEGEIIKILKDKDRVLISGVNMIKKHQKPSSEKPEGGIVEKEASIHISNIALIDPKSNKPTRVGYIIKGDVKQRVSKSSGEVI